VALEDIKNAEKLGYKIKLIAKAKQSQDAFDAAVAPMLVNKSSQLYNVDDVFNGIVVSGNAIGDVMFYGQGAGKRPTASAVAADVMDALTKSTKNMEWEASDGDYVSDYKNQLFKHYIREEDESYFITPELNEDELNKYLFGKNIKSAIKIL
jgi:homoserine dehydrogenase